MNRDQLIEMYFRSGLSHKEILSVLAAKLNLTLSLRQLKRILKKSNLYRRKHKSNIEDVVRFLRDQLSKSGKMHGYRWLHFKSIQHGLVVTQDTVRLLLQILDPAGVEQRKRKRLRRRKYKGIGPNYTWHLDSYDKLKPYGICVHGCIDGFSRRIIWLEASKTSNDPKVIAGYMVEAVVEFGGCPLRIRADRGTENSVVRDLQTFLRRNHNDSMADEKSFVMGQSIANQRIEAWWSVLRKECSQFWMNLFGELKDNGDFSGNWMDKELVRFCFMNMIQDELDEIVRVWNYHRLQGNRNATEPTGRPAVMYTSPGMYNAQDQLVAVDANDVAVCFSECIFKSDVPCDKDFFDLCVELMEDNDLDPPGTPQNATDLYLALRYLILNLL